MSSKRKKKKKKKRETQGIKTSLLHFFLTLINTRFRKKKKKFTFENHFRLRASKVTVLRGDNFTLKGDTTHLTFFLSFIYKTINASSASDWVYQAVELSRPLNSFSEGY